MLKKEQSYVTRKMSGTIRATPCGIYKYMRPYSAQINYSLSSVCPFTLRISDDIEIRLKILGPGSMFFCPYKSAYFYKSIYFNDKRIVKGSSILVKNIRGVIFHREICREKDMIVIKSLDEVFIFNEFSIKTTSSNSAIFYDSNINNFLRPLELKQVNYEEIFEKVTVSLMHNRALLEDLEKNMV